MQYMSTQDNDFDYVKTDYINLAHHLEELVLRWLGKGSVFQVDLEIVDRSGDRHTRAVYVYAIDQRRAEEKARILGQTIPLSRGHAESSPGLFLPKRQVHASPEEKPKGLFRRVVRRARHTAKVATFHDGVPRPFALTKSHIASMLDSKGYATVEQRHLTVEFTKKYAQRCIWIALLWFCVTLLGFAVLLSGIHPRNISQSIFGLLNPFTVFGSVALIVGGLGLAHAALARRNAIRWLNQKEEH